MDPIILDLDTNVKNANTIKELVLDKLYNDKVITKEVHTKYKDKYQIILFKKSWFKSLFSQEKGWFFKIISFDE